MASTSDGGEDKENTLDTHDVQLAIEEGHFVEPTPTGASTSRHSRLSVPEAANEGTEPPAQGRKTSDLLPTAVTRRQAFKKLGSTLSTGEDPLTEERHSEQSTMCRQCMAWVTVSCVCDMSALLLLVHWCV